MDRNKFLKTCSLAWLGGSALSALVQSCASSNYFALHTVSENRIIVKKSEFIGPENKGGGLRTYVLVKSEKHPFPICIYQFGGTEYSALLMECTHKGCELQAHGDFLVCPCHGSEFSNKGVVQNPPAEQNLQMFKITTDNDNIYVHI